MIRRMSLKFGEDRKKYISCQWMIQPFGNVCGNAKVNCKGIMRTDDENSIKNNLLHH